VNRRDEGGRGIFAAVGAAIMFGRAGATVDRRRQSLVKWWGMLGLRVEERAPLHSSVTEIPGHELEEIGFSDVESQLSRRRETQATAPIHGRNGAKQAAIPPVLRSLLHSFGRGGRITARSDRDSVSFGVGLSNAEAEYLVAVIRKALIG
jgi:hypothetical protein